MAFDAYRLIFTIFVIIACWYVCQKDNSYEFKVFFLLFFIFITIYCGLGAALVEAPIGYLFYFILYIIVFTIATRLLNKSKVLQKVIPKRETLNNVVVKIIDRYGFVVIVLFFILNLLILIYPENRIVNLIHPPMPDIAERLSFYGDKQNYSSIFENLKTFLLPIFYMFLFKYKGKILFIGILLILNLYMTYCADSYASRGVILQTLLVLFFLYYISSDKMKRKKIVIVSISFFPLFIIAFVLYSFARIGDMGVSISFEDAFELLFSQEICYPLQYNDYINSSGNLIDEYLTWFFLQPLPGLLKFGLGGDVFNEVFTNVVYDKFAWENSFSIALPGLVGESIFIFKNLFFVHAILLATVLSIVFNYLRKRPYLFILFVYYTIKFAQELPRGGTQSVYSALAKGFLFLVIVLYFMERFNRARTVDFGKTASSIKIQPNE